MNSTGSFQPACLKMTNVWPSFHLNSKITCVPIHSFGPFVHDQWTTFFCADSTTFILQNPKSMTPPFFALPLVPTIHQWRRPSIVERALYTFSGVALIPTL